MSLIVKVFISRPILSRSDFATFSTSFANISLSLYISSILIFETISLSLPSSTSCTVPFITSIVSLSFPVLNCSIANNTLAGSDLTFIIATPSVSIGTPLLSKDSWVFTSTFMFSSDNLLVCSKNGTTNPPLPLITLLLSPVTTIALSWAAFFQVIQISQIITNARIIHPKLSVKISNSSPIYTFPLIILGIWK